jgi:arylformamidase
MDFSVSVGHAMDLTQTIKNGMTTYVGDPVPRITKYKRLTKDGVNISVLTMGSHTGTHVDAPAHFVKGGSGLDELPVENFVGEAAVLDLSSKPPGSAITSSDLQEHSDELAPETIALLYTGMSKKWEDRRARRSITYLDGGAANWLVHRRVKAVGIDYLSVEKFGAKFPVAHVTLLSHGIPIIEALNDNLSRLVGHRILFFCLPIKVGGCDGAPARAMAYPLVESGNER